MYDEKGNIGIFWNRLRELSLTKVSFWGTTLEEDEKLNWFGLDYLPNM